MQHSILSGKLVFGVSKLLKKNGSTWPGHIALKTDPKFIRLALQKNPGIKIVLVAGTNGKTTTTKALSHILQANNIETLTNQAGANLLNGLASMLVKHISMGGVLRHKAIIFEVDENSLPLVLNEIPHPDAIILLNLFRDQLDRYGEVNATSEKWLTSLKKLNEQTLVIANADDPQIAYIAEFAKNKIFFTIEDKFKIEKKLSHAVDSISCPKCSNILTYSKISYSHIGNYSCSKCDFAKPKAKTYIFETSLLGTYNKYNLSAAIMTIDKVFGINPYTSFEAIKSLKPAFGRQETIEINDKKVMLLLSKNPTGFNESLKVALNQKNANLLLLLNDRIPDGKDISWIWDVDFEVLENYGGKVFASGDRAYDLANRLLFANITHEVHEDFENAYAHALQQTAKGKTLTILPTYSAMLEIRQLISGKSIL